MSGRNIAIRRLPLAAKRGTARLLCHPWMGALIALLFRDCVPHRGLRINTRGKEIRPSTKASLFWGFYESAEVRFITHHLAPDRDVVELGSSIGVVSSHIARRLQPGRRLICVEANPTLLPYIRCNVLGNVPTTDLVLVSMAIDYSLAPGRTATLERGELNTTSRIAAAPGSGSATLSVTTTTLAELIRSHGVGHFTLVMDIEGGEAGLLANDAEALVSCDQLIVELHHTQWQGREVSVDAMAASCQRMGFREVARHGPVYVFDRVSER